MVQRTKFTYSLLCLIAIGCNDITFGGGDGDGPFTNIGAAGYAGAAGAGPSAGGDGGAGGLAPGVVPTGVDLGGDCASEECRAGLTCVEDVCEATGETVEDGSCLISLECEEGLRCTRGRCAPAGTGERGDACFQDQECAAGLRCGILGFSAQCVPEGAGSLSDACAANIDCLSGLVCTENECTPPSPLDVGLPANPASIWPGETCEPKATGEVRAYFEIPGVEEPEGRPGDFFRLPFPNDALVKNGRIDLSGFPTPGPDFLGFDPVEPYVDAIETYSKGFSPSTNVYFRFSGVIDFDSLDGNGPVIIDITPGDEGVDQGGAWFTSVSQGDISSNKYICHNWLLVRRDRAYLPGRTYAVLFTSDDVVDSEGRAVRTSPQLAALLTDATPGDAVLAAAHEKYAPLRAYLADPERSQVGSRQITASNVLNAAVFTIEDVQAPMEELAAAVYAEPVPMLKSWVKCAAGAVSPCPQAEGERACGEGTAAYDEYHALVELPIFQTGTPPYLTVEDGGNIDASAPTRTEDVCIAVTVPKAGPATAVAVYGHGTGGSFRSNVVPQVAGALSEVQTPGGATVRFITVGIDEPQHGPRRGDSEETPDNLFFNFRNPLGSRGSPMQGAADFIGLGRALQSFTIPGSVTGAEDIVVDAAKLVFFGHSQGSTHGSLAMPYAAEYSAVVLSGNGASLKHGLTLKTSPVNIPAGVALALQEFSPADFDNLDSLTLPDGRSCSAAKPYQPCGIYHPVLNLLQQFIDPADPVNFAKELTRLPEAGEVGKHVFQTLGTGDTYAPVEQMIIYAQAGAFTEVEPDSSATEPAVIYYGVGSPPPAATPESVPYAGAGDNATIGIRQYGPPQDRDGHFVVFDVAAATNDVARFLGMAVTTDEKPQIGQ